MALSSAHELIQKALRTIPAPTGTKRINLALSGGIDSSVSGLLLLEKGWEVQPYTMRCWDDAETTGEVSCWEKEVRAARAAAESLSLPVPLEVDLVSDYWTRVFQPFLEGVKKGWIMNADIGCNREIKFGEFVSRVGGMIGTGHYARVVNGGLRSGVDEKKDQSYFLASVKRDVFERIVFPVGWLRKDEVRDIGRWAGLPGLFEESSRGMCFVGKRSMGKFVSRYIDQVEGRFVDVDGRIIGKMKWGGCGYTVGQRAKVGGLDSAVYVVGKKGDDVIVAKEGDKRLFSGGVFCRRVEWMNGEVCGRVMVKTCSTATKMGALVRRIGDEGWVMVFDNVVRRVTQGQAVVLYDDNGVVLGAGWPAEDLRSAEVLGRYMQVGWSDVAFRNDNFWRETYLGKQCQSAKT